MMRLSVTLAGCSIFISIHSPFAQAKVILDLKDKNIIAVPAGAFENDAQKRRDIKYSQALKECVLHLCLRNPDRNCNVVVNYQTEPQALPGIFRIRDTVSVQLQPPMKPDGAPVPHSFLVTVECDYHPDADPEHKDIALAMAGIEQFNLKRRVLEPQVCVAPTQKKVKFPEQDLVQPFSSQGKIFLDRLHLRPHSDLTGDGNSTILPPKMSLNATRRLNAELVKLRKEGKEPTKEEKEVLIETFRAQFPLQSIAGNEKVLLFKQLEFLSHERHVATQRRWEQEQIKIQNDKDLQNRREAMKVIKEKLNSDRLPDQERMQLAKELKEHQEIVYSVASIIQERKEDLIRISTENLAKYEEDEEKLEEVARIHQKFSESKQKLDEISNRTREQESERNVLSEKIRKLENLEDLRSLGFSFEAKDLHVPPLEK